MTWAPAVGDLVEWRTPVARRWHRPYRVLHTADLGPHGHLVAVIHVLPDGTDDDWPYALWLDGAGIDLRPLDAAPTRQLSLLEVTA